MIFPLKMVIFHSELLVNQRVTHGQSAFGSPRHCQCIEDDQKTGGSQQHFLHLLFCHLYLWGVPSCFITCSWWENDSDMVAWFQRKPNKTWDVGTPQYYQEKIIPNWKSALNLPVDHTTCIHVCLLTGVLPYRTAVGWPFFSSSYPSLSPWTDLFWLVVPVVPVVAPDFLG